MENNSHSSRGRSDAECDDWRLGEIFRFSLGGSIATLLAAAVAALMGAWLGYFKKQAEFMKQP